MKVLGSLGQGCSPVAAWIGISLSSSISPCGIWEQEELMWCDAVLNACCAMSIKVFVSDPRVAYLLQVNIKLTR